MSKFLRWTKLSKECYERGCICSSCPFYETVKDLDSTNICNVKTSVLELVKIFGKPKGIEIQHIIDEV